MNFIILYLLIFASIILNIEILSLFKGINFINLLILTLFEISGFIFFCKKFNYFGKTLLSVKKFLHNLKTVLSDKLLFSLFLGFYFCIIISFILCLISPPVEADASSYHALRALFYAKDGFLHYLNIADARCNTMPFNSEIVYVWFLTLFKTDTTIGLLQFFSYFALIISSYKIMELFNIDFKARLWSIFIFSSFAGIISQISSTQTDLTVGALFSISMYLILEYKKNNSNNNPPFHLLYFSSLALSISMGVKSTGVIGSIPLIIYYIFILRDNKKQIFQYIFFLILNFFIFSSYNYILNFINYGSFFGAKTLVNAHSLYYTNFFEFLTAGLSNFIRYIFHLFDFSGCVIFALFSPLYDFIYQSLFHFLNIDPLFNTNGETPKLNASLTEQIMGFGVVSVFVILPSIVISFFKKIRIFSLIFLFQTLILCFTIIYFPTSIRFFAAFIVFLIPAFSYLYKKSWYTFFVSILALFSLIYTPLNLNLRPFCKIIPKFFKEPYSVVINNIRDLNYDYYLITKKFLFIKNALLKYAKGKTAGVILRADDSMVYPIKYADFKGEINIDFLKIDEPLNLEKYDFILIEGDFQEITNINKVKPEFCNDNFYNNRLIGFTCYLNKNLYNMFQFVPFVELNYSADEFLKKFGSDEDSVFYLLKKNVTNY